VSATVTGTSVTLIPLSRHGGDPLHERLAATLVRTITATISPGFVQSTTVYDLTGGPCRW